MQIDKNEKYATEQILTQVIALIPAEVIEEAQKLDFEVYAVGGCVRNTLLGLDPGDVDLAVVGDALKLAKNIAKRLGAPDPAVYRRFGTALIKTKAACLELATARRESYDPASRKPTEVIAVPIEEDLQRRDFTINALAYGLTGRHENKLIDLFNGLEDLSNRILRTPLDPDKTFSDDPLRMFRAIRFASVLNFDIYRETWAGIRQNAHRIEIVAFERLKDEFWKMLSGRDPVLAVRMMIESGLMAYYMPEILDLAGVEQIGKHHHKDVLNHSLKVMQNVAQNSSDPVLRLAALLHDAGKPATKKFDAEQGWTFHGHEVVGAKLTRKIGRRLKLGKDNINRLVQLVSLHMRPVNLTAEEVTDSAIRRLMVESGDLLDEQLILCRADITSSNSKKVGLYLDNFDYMRDRMDEVRARDKLRDFNSPIRGEEIMKIIGIEPGPMVGALKERIEDAILDGVIPNEYDAAKIYLLEIKDEVLSTDIKEILEERRKRSQKRRSITGDFVFPE